MNILPFSSCRIHPRLSMAGWATVGFVVSTASAQVNKPPNAKDTDGNQYMYPVLTSGHPQRSPLEVDPRRTSSVVAAIQHKLDTIIIPRLDFHDASLTDAIEEIRQDSERLDTDHDPATHGLNIFLKLPATTTPSTARVTMTLADVSVMDALRGVAGKVGLKVKVEQYAVSLVPLSESTEPMFTAEYHVPPEVLGLASIQRPPTLDEQTGPPYGIGRNDMKAWLEERKISFPPGASATYLPGPQKLVVRNTRDNLDQVQSLVHPTPKNP